jgi:hypothetical protein
MACIWKMMIIFARLLEKNFNDKYTDYGQESSTYDPRRMGRGKTG